MTLTFYALWMLCALGTAVLATAVRTRLDWAVLALGFALTTAWTIRGLLTEVENEQRQAASRRAASST